VCAFSVYSVSVFASAVEGVFAPEVEGVGVAPTGFLVYDLRFQHVSSEHLAMLPDILTRAEQITVMTWIPAFCVQPFLRIKKHGLEQRYKEEAPRLASTRRITSHS